MKKLRVNIRQQDIDLEREVKRGNKFKCFFCDAVFDKKGLLEGHLEHLHGRFSEDIHRKQPDSKVHKIYMRNFIDKPKQNYKDLFDPKKAYEEYRKFGVKPSEFVNTVNNPDTPEERRIYSADGGRIWCQKTTKESADKCFESIAKMKERMKTRGTRYIEPDMVDRIMFGKLKLRNPKGDIDSIDILYMYDQYSRTYRIFTQATRYNDFEEIVFSNDNQCYVLKRDLNKPKEVPVYVDNLNVGEKSLGRLNRHDMS